MMQLKECTEILAGFLYNSMAVVPQKTRIRI